jgi:hypothetical protein
LTVALKRAHGYSEESKKRRIEEEDKPAPRSGVRRTRFARQGSPNRKDKQRLILGCLSL